MPSEAPLRLGLAGTGYWAQVTHAPALAAADGIELAAVWGRDARRAARLAADRGAAACTDFDEFLAGVDAVGFSVPPDVQQELAVRAARAGKHLLLEKPIALSAAAADELAGAVAAAGVASVVFFTHRFKPEVRAWLAEVAAGGPWLGATLTWLGTAMEESSPFNTPWRREKGGLWDLGPHAVSLLWASLGPVVSVTADAGPSGVTYLVLHHESGVTSSATLTLDAPRPPTPSSCGCGASPASRPHPWARTATPWRPCGWRSPSWSPPPAPVTPATRVTCVSAATSWSSWPRRSAPWPPGRSRS